MLRIVKIEMRGFKSFCERTVVEFPQGITAVVGPNGCGKSNIADALSWVLGEQSARALRGRRMEDVIFAGSDGRGPGGMAEVTLHMKSIDGSTLPSGKDGVQLTRRLFRTGDSDYLIDGQATRLTDIRALLDEVRAGRRTYGIIDQQHVASFVVSKPRERRVFIEEAAGIAGFKQRRRLTENKLDATRANLLRVDDIVREVERQMRSLKRQASSARRARRLDDELRGLRTVWYRRRDVSLAKLLGELENEHEVSRRETDHLAAERDRVSGRLSEAREELERAHQERKEADDASHESRLQEERLMREIDGARQKAETLEAEAGRQEGEAKRLAADAIRREEERERLSAILEEVGQEATRLAEALTTAESRVEEIERGRGAAQQRASDLEKSWYEAIHDRADLSAKLAATQEASRREVARVAEAKELRERLSRSKGAALASLGEARRDLESSQGRSERIGAEIEAAEVREREAQEELEAKQAEASSVAADLGSCAGEKAALDSIEVRLAGADATLELLERSRQQGGVEVRGILADLLRVDPVAERAVEACLRERLAGVVVDGRTEVRTAAALGLGGRLGLLPLDLAREGGSPPEPVLPESLRRDPRVDGPLAGRVGAAPGHEHLAALVRRSLDRVVLVADLDGALDLAREHRDWRFVSRSGDVAEGHGFVTLHGAGEEKQEGLLARSRRRDRLSEKVRELEEGKRTAADAVEAAREAVREARTAREQLETERGTLAEQIAELASRTEQLEREARRLEREEGLTDAVLQQASTARDASERDAEDLSRRIEGRERAIEEARGELETAREAVRTEDARLRESSQALAAVRSEKRAREERLEGLRSDVARVVGELGELRLAGEQGEEVRERARERAAELRHHADDQTKSLDACRERRITAEQQVKDRSARLEVLSKNVKSSESELDLVAQQFEECRTRREQGGLEVQKSRLELEHEREACREELGCEPSELPDTRPEDIPAEVLDSDDLLKERISEMRGKRERVGPVNLLAENEYGELETRFEELTVQRDDLQDTIKELTESIRKMNRESRERFVEAFHEIRRHYKEQFARLFRGGRADLILEDEEDPLESGIEIMCQPPGKKLQSVSLLSGGEKALSATAVLFAIFKFQPPPFCLLDEVDAPLDDANVGRFADGLRSFTDSTQFILITHNKRSMETADVLYGVTMPEPGVSKLVSMTLD